MGSGVLLRIADARSLELPIAMRYWYFVTRDIGSPSQCYSLVVHGSVSVATFHSVHEEATITVKAQSEGSRQRAQ
jgi:hypothetical protein